MTDSVKVGNRSLDIAVGVSSAWKKWKVLDSDDESDNSNNDKPIALNEPFTTPASTDFDQERIKASNKKRTAELISLKKTPDVDSLLMEVAAKKLATDASLAARSTLAEKKPIIEEARNKHKGEVQRQRIAVEGTAYDVQTMEFPGELLHSKDSRSSTRSKSNNAVNAKATEKESLKERTKRQRLSGQSGIGEEFKTWRSEEEMKQRQQYD